MWRISPVHALIHIWNMLCESKFVQSVYKPIIQGQFAKHVTILCLNCCDYLCLVIGVHMVQNPSIELQTITGQRVYKPLPRKNVVHVRALKLVAIAISLCDGFSKGQKMPL